MPAGVMVFIILLLLGTLLYFVLVRRQGALSPAAEPPPIAATGAGEVSGPLVTENGIVFGGLPRASAGYPVTVLRNIAYISGYSDARRDPLYVCYHVIATEHPFRLPRPTGNFVTDTRTRARTTHDDFTGSGFDRGHMAPNAAIAHCFGADAQHETFLLSNICPQSPNLNERVWDKLEAREVPYADKSGEVWVTDGPIFADLNGGAARTLRSGIAVPAAFYKILVERTGGRVRVFSVIMPQSVRGTELPGPFLSSIAEIEKETGLTFLPEVAEGASLKGKVWPMW